jgi:hypothetical protein
MACLDRAWKHLHEGDILQPNIFCYECQKFAKALAENFVITFSSAIRERDRGWSSVPWHPMFKHHSTLKSLQRSFQAGCHLCTLLYLNLDSSWEAAVETAREIEGDRISIAVNVDCGPILSNGSSEKLSFLIYLRLSSLQLGKHQGAISLRLEFAVNQSLNLITGRSQSIGLTVEASSAKSEVPILDNIATSTSSKYTLELAKRWIQDCTTTHDECSQPTPGVPANPSRLVDVTSGNDSLRIHKTLPGAKLKFIALSHCWGGARFLKLQTHNYVDLNDEFYINDLPQTWREAIQLARILGYNYIWIDALCIIQDSEYDWETEAVLMGEVYSNCDLNLAALGSNTSEGGLFHRRNPLLFTPCDLSSFFQDVTWPQSMSLSFAAIRAQDSIPEDCSIQQILQACGPSEYSKAMTKEPLNQRAWVLQERALSRRTLYYGKSGIFWDCIRTEMDEYSNSHSCSITTVSSSLRPIPDLVNAKKTLQHSQTAPGSIDWGWYHLLALYARTSISFESDRLIAIASLAKEVQRRSGLSYLAGLWKSLLPEELLWAPLDTSKIKGDYLNNKFPSWSWASLPSGSGLFWPYLERAKSISKIEYRARIKYADVGYPTLLPHNPNYGKQGPFGPQHISNGTINMQAIVHLNLPEMQLEGKFLFDSDTDEAKSTPNLSAYVTLLRAVLLDGQRLDFGLIVRNNHAERDPINMIRHGMYFCKSLDRKSPSELLSHEYLRDIRLL